MASDPLFYTSMLPTGLEDYLRKNSETIKAAVAHKTAGYEGIPVSTRAQASLITRAFLTERRHEAKLMYETLRERSRNLEAEKQSYERMQTAAPLPAVMSAALGLVRRASPSVSDTVGKTLARFPLVGPAVVFAVGGLSAVGYTVYQIRKIEEIQKEKQHERWAALWQEAYVRGTDLRAHLATAQLANDSTLGTLKLAPHMGELAMMCTVLRDTSPPAFEDVYVAEEKQLESFVTRDQATHDSLFPQT